ncbi:hypothetical protein BDQ17DRAFT_1551202 [Cyathus striatus]|nr:hypothetical protein BDQ17DRAFT_1551202 [Cyathus striatus]
MEIAANSPVHYAVFIRNVSSLSSLTVLVWEYLLTCGDEYQYIWIRPFTFVKAVYLFSRYIALISLIINNVFVLGRFSTLPVAREECQIMFQVLTALSCSMLAALDFILMLRVYVLYNRSWKVAAAFIGMLFVEAVLVSACSSHTVPVVPFDGACNVTKTPYDVIYFASSVVLTHCVLFFMTIARRKIGFGRTPIVQLIVRDGAWIFVLVISILSVNVPYSLYTEIARPHLVLGWPAVLLSTATCRLIINMQRLPLNSDYSIQFTSVVDMSMDFHTDSQPGSTSITLGSSSRYNSRLECEREHD